MSAYRLKRPDTSPSTADLAERDAFQALTAESLKNVRASAETWRNGLTAFITLVTTGVVIKGRDTTAFLDTGWRVAVTLFVGVGLGCAVLGLWQTLAAQAGDRSRTITLAEVHHRHASVAAYQVALAARSASRIRQARLLVAAALVLLLAGVAATWWAPARKTSPLAHVFVSYGGGSTACGVLVSGDHGVLRIRMAGAAVPLDVPFSSVESTRLVAACP